MDIVRGADGDLVAGALKGHPMRGIHKILVILEHWAVAVAVAVELTLYKDWTQLHVAQIPDHGQHPKWQVLDWNWVCS